MNCRINNRADLLEGSSREAIKYIEYLRAIVLIDVIVDSDICNHLRLPVVILVSAAIEGFGFWDATSWVGYCDLWSLCGSFLVERRRRCLKFLKLLLQLVRLKLRVLVLLELLLLLLEVLLLLLLVLLLVLWRLDA